MSILLLILSLEFYDIIELFIQWYFLFYRFENKNNLYLKERNLWELLGQGMIFKCYKFKIILP